MSNLISQRQHYPMQTRTCGHLTIRNPCELEDSLVLTMTFGYANEFKNQFNIIS